MAGIFVSGQVVVVNTGESNTCPEDNVLVDACAVDSSSIPLFRRLLQLMSQLLDEPITLVLSTHFGS